MKMVSTQVNEVINNLNTPFNFGLWFNKWLDYEHDGNLSRDLKINHPTVAVREYGKSRKTAEKLLAQKQLHQANYLHAMEESGWTPVVIRAKNISSYITGTGLHHPTEVGLDLDRNSGMPYIPAAGQKGAMRLAHVINSLRDKEGNWLSEDELANKGLVIRNQKNGELEWNEDNDAGRALFGTGGQLDTLAGHLVILDAFPLGTPELGSDIMNSHYGKYYSSGGKERGPTEDQQLNPVKFLVVKPGTEFVFRFLLRPARQECPVRDMELLQQAATAALQTALEEEGIGAKTAAGYGRFQVTGHGEPSCIDEWRKEEEEKQFPWRPLLQGIEACAGWGELTSIIKKMENEMYLRQVEVGEAIRNKALSIRKNTKIHKWKDERDAQLVDVLDKSGLSWQKLEAAPVQTGETAMDFHNTELLKQIQNFSCWKDFKSAKIRFAGLDLQCALCLKAKFLEWRLKKSKDKQQKKAFKNLVKRINKLQ